MPSIVVDKNGTELAYLDSGVPTSSPDTYVTIFAIHGMLWGYHVYDKLLAAAPAAGVRFVAISRRGYPGSTPFEDNEIAGLTTDEARQAFLRARGAEVAEFISRFIEEFPLPKSGGAALMGWSLGAMPALAAVANLDALSEEAAERVRTYVHTLILHDPAPLALGTPLAPKSWSPASIPDLTPLQSGALSAQFLSAYFAHGDLAARDPEQLEYVVPATFRAPSVFNAMPEDIMAPQAVPGDLAFTFGAVGALHASYRRAVFGEGAAEGEGRPRPRVRLLVGEASVSFSLAAAFQIIDDNDKEGGKAVEMTWLPNMNHFPHWDEPELTLKAFKDAIAN